MNYKTLVTTTVEKLAQNRTELTGIQNETRRLGVGYALATAGEDLKKKSKAGLKKLGIIPQTFSEDSSTLLLNDGKFVLMARTAIAAQRLDKAALLAALDAERLSTPAKARILAAAYKTAAPGTTFTIEQK